MQRASGVQERVAPVSMGTVPPPQAVTLGDEPIEPEGPVGAKSPAGLSPSQIAWRRLRRDKMAITCMGVVLFFVFIAVFAGVLTGMEGQDYTTNNTDLVDLYGFPTIGPTPEHWFGVEPRTGRDLFAQWAFGARPSLIIATVAAVSTTIIGVAAGLLAGYRGGWVDRTISWVVDLVLSLPYLIIAIAMVSISVSIAGGPEALTPDDNARIRFVSLIIVLVLFGWASLARLIRGEVISLREREFIAAAKVIGVRPSRILVKELLPNLVAPIVVSLSLALPGFIVAEAGLSLLGVGLIDPIPSWGQMIAKATPWYQAFPLYLWIPVLSVSLLTLALSWLGDSIRDAFDPKTRR